MNPIVYNKNGQFRFTDFVGYLPEFLQSEPDVVTYLQVMSDYINNAYRNVEVTDEFELVKVCTSTDIKRVTRWMNNLCDMFKLACDRGEPVMYLSVPRNNIRNNVILGNSTAEYAREIECDLDDIEDSLPSARSRMGITDDSEIHDGDIIYVIYRNRPLKEKVAYYFASNSDTLIKDSMASSQDPFTGTYNDPNTAIQFKVVNVDKVVKRFGGRGPDGFTVFYEVSLPIQISEVKRIASNGTVSYDVDVDGAPDSIFVDYYNIGSTSLASGYNTYIKFSDDNKFNWVGEYPSGIFYFRESSSANLSKVDNTSSELLPDTLLNPSVNRYRIVGVKKISGMYRIYTEAFPGIYKSALFYVIDDSALARTDRMLGVYKMNGDVSDTSRFDEGEFYVDLVNVSGTDYDLQAKLDAPNPHTLVLVSIPLAESKYVLDYDSSYPVIKWDKDEITGVNAVELGAASNIEMTAVDRIENEVVYDDIVDRMGQSIISVHADLTDKLCVGDHIISNAFRFVDPNTGDIIDTPAIARITRMTGMKSDGKYQIYIADATETIRYQIITNPNLSSEKCQIVKCTVGYMFDWRSDWGEPGGDTFACNAILSPLQENDLVIVQLTDDTERIFKVQNIHYQTIVFYNAIDQSTLPLDQNIIKKNVPFSKLSLRTDGVKKFKYVKNATDGEHIIAAVNPNAYRGDIFTPRYMLANLVGDTEVSLLRMYMDVLPYDPEQSYTTGTYVYDAPYIYKIIQTTTTDSEGRITNHNNRSVDRVAHYSIGFKEVNNVFMPYCGPVSTLEYNENVNYLGDMDNQRLPLYIKKVTDVRLKYGWNQRQYLYYNEDIGVAPMDRAGFMEIYSGTNDRSPVDIDLATTAESIGHVVYEPALLYNCGSKYYDIDIDANPMATVDADGNWTVTVRSSGHGLIDGITIESVVDPAESTDNQKIFATDGCKVIVQTPDVFQYVVTPTELVTGLTAIISDVKNIHIKYNRCYDVNETTKSEVYPVHGDIAVVKPSNTVYVVNEGSWEAVENTKIIVPTTIYSRHNLFDESVTNPTFALGDGYTIKTITVIAPGVAELQLSGRVPDFDHEGASAVYNDKGRVYIEYVNQGVFNGWHTIKEIMNGGVIRIYIDGSVQVDPFIAPVLNRKMTLHAGRWYKYTLYGYDWDKISNCQSYVTANTVSNAETYEDDDDTYVYTKYAHKLSVGDSVIIDVNGNGVYDINAASGNTVNLHETTVVRVIDDFTIVLAGKDYGFTFGQTSIYRGFIIDGFNLSRLNGEYAIHRNGELIRFRNGDIVVTLSQTCLDEIHGWRVSESSAWIPMRKKRTFKIDRLAVDMTRNPAYDIGDDFDTESEYRYVTYSDMDVAADAAAYTVGYANARNYHFEKPHVDNLDTTQKAELEYSSKYDYASVAPRDNMDATFQGVPDMGYPLAERIERLAYLRDPNVIDIDLIGYLARFMGYDITAVADDIKASNIYHNNAEREEAIRETIAHLPQFYALSGTKPGINMLMATFGLVGELITMWTSTDDPYGKLVRQDEVGKYIDADLAAGKTTASWVPTPHVTLDVIENENFNSVLLGNEELSRMKEQIRRCKPINVVFDGIRVIYETNVVQTPMIGCSGAKVTYGDVPFFEGSGADEIVLNTDPCDDDDCSF